MNDVYYCNVKTMSYSIVFKLLNAFYYYIVKTMNLKKSKNLINSHKVYCSSNSLSKLLLLF